MAKLMIVRGGTAERPYSKSQMDDLTKKLKGSAKRYEKIFVRGDVEVTINE